MLRAFMLCVVSLLLGGAGIWLAMQSSAPDSATCALACEPELVNLRERIRVLEGDLAKARSGTLLAVTAIAPAPAPTPAVLAEPLSSSEGGHAEPISTPNSNAVRWRVSAIEKFVPITDDQRQRLTSKFQAEAQGANDTDSLESILGDENTRFYRQQVAAAFEKVQQEELDKEVVWLSRQLTLTPEQEQKVNEVFEEIERELSDAQDGEHGTGGNSQERVRTMIEENRRRRELRAEKLRGVLSPDQSQMFSRVEAESSSSDMEVFHDAGS